MIARNSRLLDKNKSTISPVLVPASRSVQCTFENAMLQRVYYLTWSEVALSEAALQGWYRVNIPTRRTVILLGLRKITSHYRNTGSRQCRKCAAFDLHVSWKVGGEQPRFYASSFHAHAVTNSHDRSIFKYRTAIFGPSPLYYYINQMRNKTNRPVD